MCRLLYDYLMEIPTPNPEDIGINEELTTDPEMERQERVSRILELVEKINELGEILPFPGIHPDAYLKMKETDEEFPGYTTPIEELVARFEAEGIKVVLGKNETSGNVFVLPAGSNNIEMDSIFPHQLEINNIESEELRELIGLQQAISR